MRAPQRVRRWKNAEISPDGSSLWAELETEGGDTADLEIPLSDVGLHVAFLIGSASAANSEDVDEDAVRKDTKPVAIIPIEGLGFSTGRTATETVLLVRVAGHSLGLALNKKQLDEVGKGLAQTAALLQADVGKPQ